MKNSEEPVFPKTPAKNNVPVERPEKNKNTPNPQENPDPDYIGDYS